MTKYMQSNNNTRNYKSRNNIVNILWTNLHGLVKMAVPISESSNHYSFSKYMACYCIQQLLLCHLSKFQMSIIWLD